MTHARTPSVHATPRRFAAPALSAWLACAALLGSADSASAANGADDSPARAVQKEVELVDAPLAAYQGELLTLAHEVASALPTHPHAKNRARMQADVVTACLELDQPRRALSYIETIDNWRRGSTYADLAGHLARHGRPEHVQHFLALADAVAENRKADPNEQDWRPELIQTKIAAVLVAATPDQVPVDYDARVAELDLIVKRGGLEETHFALTEYARLYDQQYDTESRRNGLYTKILNGWDKSPVQFRFDVVMQLVDAALGHGDRRTALVLIGQARLQVDSIEFAAEDRVRLFAQLSDALHRAGDASSAKVLLDSASSLYDTSETQIVDIYRSQALRALAEQYARFGEKDKALALYERAVEAGIANPNSRPRADDLQAVCCSLARSALDPGTKLMKRLREIRAGLGDPW